MAKLGVLFVGKTFHLPPQLFEFSHFGRLTEVWPDYFNIYFFLNQGPEIFIIRFFGKTILQLRSDFLQLMGQLASKF